MYYYVLLLCEGEVVGRGVLMSLDEKAEGCSLIPDGYYKCVCRTPQCNSFETPKAPCSRRRQSPSSVVQNQTHSLTTSISDVDDDDSREEPQQPKYKYRFREQKLREQMIRMQLDRSRGVTSSTFSPFDLISSLDVGVHDEVVHEDTAMRLVNFARFPQQATSDVQSLVSLESQ